MESTHHLQSQLKDYLEKFVKFPPEIKYEDVNDREKESEFNNIKPLIEFYFSNDEPLLAFYTI